MKVLLFTSILFSGLVAGLFYSYSCSVNPGLRSLPDAGYIRAMQSINNAIQNPAFFISFMGLLILLPVTAFKLYGQNSTSFYFMIASMLLYFVGVFGVTIFCNVPLNEQLAKFNSLSATEHDISAMRQAFEKPWNAFHSIRTIAAVISFGLALLSTLKLKS